jgi:hypothetical protein
MLGHDRVGLQDIDGDVENRRIGANYMAPTNAQRKNGVTAPGSHGRQH